MKKTLLTLFTLLAFTGSSFAAEDLSEKASAVGHNAKRKVKKGANRTKEAFCMEGDLKCAGKKAKNRLNEAGDTVSDKAKEVKENVD